MLQFRLVLLSAVLLSSFGIACSKVQAQPKIQTGLEVLKAQNFKVLEGKRVGIVTNPTGVDNQLRSVADILVEAANVNVVALYGPEHGIRGDFEAGDKVENAVDEATGLPVFSLYGKTRKPTPEMLEGVDAIVYDIQDIGSRSYTYISTLGFVMEAAAEAGIEVVVLDRPNPLGGNRWEGNLAEKGFISFVSQFEIPYVHSFTVGELAKFLNGEKLLEGGIQCELTVVEMQGWNRDMIFQDTQLEWIPSSPHVPDAETAFYYSTTGILGELQAYSEGVGYPLPFKVIGAPWVDAKKFANAMNAIGMESIMFRPIHFKSYYGRDKGEMMHGVQVHITDFRKAPLMLVQFYAIQELYKLYPDKNVFEMGKAKKRINMFDKVSGTDRIRKAFEKRFMVEDILPILNEDMATFMPKAEKYFIYK
jgi:uncharacterized protein YbbC (DUF1343 family)